MTLASEHDSFAVASCCRDHPNAKDVIMGQHGLINWANDDRACYYLTLDLIETAAKYIESKYKKRGGDKKAFGGAIYTSLGPRVRERVLTALLPWLRGQIGAEKRMIGTVQTDELILRFVNSKDAPRLAELGTSCPDHFLRTKIKPLSVSPDKRLAARIKTDDGLAQYVAHLKEKLAAGLARYRGDYAAYYKRCKRPNSPAMRDPNPTVILIPGIGMIAWGKSKSESRVTAEFYNCAVEVMRGAAR